MLRWLWCAALAVAALAVNAAEAPPDKALQALFEREFHWFIKEHPEAATYVGVDSYDDRFTDHSPEAVARRRAHEKAVMAELRAFDPRRLNAQDRVSRELALEQLKQNEALRALYGPLPFEGLEGWLVVSSTGGPQHDLASLAKAMPFRDAAGYERYLKRLAAIPRLLGQMTAQMREGMRSGWMPPREVMSRVPSQFDPFVAADVAASPLFAPFTSFPPGIAEADRARLEAVGRKALAEAVRPAFVQMKRFLEEEYLPACRPTLGASALPGGLAYYALAVKINTTTTLTPEQVHRIGLQEVARIEAEMDKLVAQAGFKGTRAEFMQSLKADPHSYFTQPDEMLKAYRDIAKRVDAELPKLFAELPRQPYGIRAMEAFEGDNAEHYTPGALDGSRPGWFEANVNHLSTRPIYQMENTFLHEAVPGHHLQNARAQEIQGLPAFRRAGWYTAYGEGWALYAESLGPELGLYREPAQRFGALTWEMVRACRLVVDTGMHALGWSREQALHYLLDHTGLAQDFAEAEVDRYVVEPAQALGYKIGELKIKALRARAQAALGERFDIRRFHNAVLDDGPVPLTVLESRIDEWIAGQKQKTRTARAAGAPAAASR